MGGAGTVLRVGRGGLGACWRLAGARPGLGSTPAELGGTDVDTAGTGVGLTRGMKAILCLSNPWLSCCGGAQEMAEGVGMLSHRGYEEGSGGRRTLKHWHKLCSMVIM